jgi:hypothetical protein
VTAQIQRQYSRRLFRDHRRDQVPDVTARAYSMNENEGGDRVARTPFFEM